MSEFVLYGPQGTAAAAGAFTTLTVSGTSTQSGNVTFGAQVIIGASTTTSGLGAHELVIGNAFAFKSASADNSTTYSAFYLDSSNVWQFDGNGKGSVFTGVINSVGGYQSNGTPGITTTITTASLVGKTVTITNGLITGFA